MTQGLLPLTMSLFLAQKGDLLIDFVRGETKQQNLVLLCRSHHTLLHQVGFRIEPRKRGFAFFDPEGRLLRYAGARKSVCLDTLLKAYTDRGLHIAPESNVPMRSGKRSD